MLKILTNCKMIQFNDSIFCHNIFLLIQRAVFWKREAHGCLSVFVHIIWVFNLFIFTWCGGWKFLKVIVYCFEIMILVILKQNLVFWFKMMNENTIFIVAFCFLRNNFFLVDCFFSIIKCIMCEMYFFVTFLFCRWIVLLLISLIWIRQSI